MLSAGIFASRFELFQQLSPNQAASAFPENTSLDEEIDMAAQCDRDDLSTLDGELHRNFCPMATCFSQVFYAEVCTGVVEQHNHAKIGQAHVAWPFPLAKDAQSHMGAEDAPASDSVSGPPVEDAVMAEPNLAKMNDMGGGTETPTRGASCSSRRDVKIDLATSILNIQAMIQDSTNSHVSAD